MKTLIIYASKTGTVEKCVTYMKQKQRNLEVASIHDLHQEIEEYDCIIIGSPIRMGLLDKKIKDFILRNKECLKRKRTAFFICCCFQENFKTYFEQNIPKDLLENAIVFDSFGGELDMKKQKGFDKLMTKIVSKMIKKNNKAKILTKNIESFLDKIMDDKISS